MSASSRIRRALLLSALAAAGCYPNQIDPMKKQPKYRAYAENRFFDDQRAMRPLVAGVVPREAPTGPSELLQGRNSAGELVTVNPLPITRESLERGRQRFEIICATCHGILGDGDSVPATKMALRPPPSLHDFKNRPDGFFFQVITEGWGLMPSYAAMLTVEQRWEVVAYVRALQLSRQGRIEKVPVEVRQQLEKSP